MDLNLVVLEGTLATPAEVRYFDSGERLIRYLVTTRVTAPRRRIDVIPVTLWRPTNAETENLGDRGDRIWVSGSVQRRFWGTTTERRGSIEVVAELVRIGADVPDHEGEQTIKEESS